jgi:hypothetical protein
MDETVSCLNCGRSENQAPLVALRYQGSSAWICSQCLPILIHNPARLAGKLAHAETLSPADHHD